MMQRMKKVRKIFWAWHDDKEEQWLREMARQGWKLIKYSFPKYTFVQDEPGDYVYKLDFKSTPNEDLAEYLAFFEDAGWDHLAEFNGWHYYRTKADNKTTPDIYSDNNSRAQKYKGLLHSLGFAVLSQVAVWLVIFITPSEKYMPEWLVTGISLLASFTTLFLIYCMVRVYLKAKSLEE